MSNLLIALMIAVGASVWMYTKLQKHSGNNSKQSAFAAAIIGLFIFVILISVLTLI